MCSATKWLILFSLSIPSLGMAREAVDRDSAYVPAYAFSYSCNVGLVVIQRQRRGRLQTRLNATGDVVLDNNQTSLSLDTLTWKSATAVRERVDGPPPAVIPFGVTSSSFRLSFERAEGGDVLRLFAEFGLDADMPAAGDQAKFTRDDREISVTSTVSTLTDERKTYLTRTISIHCAKQK